MLKKKLAVYEVMFPFIPNVRNSNWFKMEYRGMNQL